MSTRRAGYYNTPKWHENLLSLKELQTDSIYDFSLQTSFLRTWRKSFGRSGRRHTRHLRLNSWRNRQAKSLHTLQFRFNIAHEQLRVHERIAMCRPTVIPSPCCCTICSQCNFLRRNTMWNLYIETYVHVRRPCKKEKIPPQISGCYTSK
jgi:hypothetical protein